ncbi:UNVERIFIED_ORG: replication initiation and membrane attachment protein DnaB [Rhizobium etli]
MTSPDIATLLDDAADRIADVSRADLQIILRRAALRLRKEAAVSLDEDVEETLKDLASEFEVTRNDMIRYIVRKWLGTNAYLPVRNLMKMERLNGDRLRPQVATTIGDSTSFDLSHKIIVRYSGAVEDVSRVGR